MFVASRQEHADPFDTGNITGIASFAELHKIQTSNHLENLRLHPMCPWKTPQNATWLFKAITKKCTGKCHLGFEGKTKQFTHGKWKLMFLNESHALLQNAGVSCYKYQALHYPLSSRHCNGDSF